MNTIDLYYQLTASALAHLYFEMDHTLEGAAIYAAGLANCGKEDFDALVAEYAAEYDERVGSDMDFSAVQRVG